MLEIPVLDKGFVKLIDFMGEDKDIAAAARTSYGNEETVKSAKDDEHLIRYLMRHQHTTPFEMCEIKLLVKLPVFVARQWIRHRTANVNEFSGRYSIMEDEFYIPEMKDIKPQSKTNKQGRSGDTFNGDVKDLTKGMIKTNSITSYQTYEKLIGMDVSRELSRVVLPLNIYTKFYWKIDLHNLFHFIKLRTEAQFEIAEYARAIESIVSGLWPVAYQAFVDYRLKAITLSRQEIEMLGKMLAQPNQTISPLLSGRELLEFEQKLALIKSSTESAEPI